PTDRRRDSGPRAADPLRLRHADRGCLDRGLDRPGSFLGPDAGRRGRGPRRERGPHPESVRRAGLSRGAAGSGLCSSAPDPFPRPSLEHSRARPRRPAIREKDFGIWQTWTWEEAASEIRALACGLAARGFQRGECLAIVGDNRPRLYWAMAAA